MVKCLNYVFNPGCHTVVIVAHKLRPKQTLFPSFCVTRILTETVFKSKYQHLFILANSNNINHRRNLEIALSVYLINLSTLKWNRHNPKRLSSIITLQLLIIINNTYLKCNVICSSNTVIGSGSSWELSVSIIKYFNCNSQKIFEIARKFTNKVHVTVYQ